MALVLTPLTTSKVVLTNYTSTPEIIYMHLCCWLAYVKFEEFTSLILALGAFLNMRGYTSLMELEKPKMTYPTSLGPLIPWYGWWYHNIIIILLDTFCDLNDDVSY